MKPLTPLKLMLTFFLLSQQKWAGNEMTILPFPKFPAPPCIRLLKQTLFLLNRYYAWVNAMRTPDFLQRAVDNTT